MAKELRTMPTRRVEVREAGEGKPRVFVGRAVEYDAWSEKLYGVFHERIAPGAFDASLAREGRDVYASVGHDPNRLLGRESAGTLSLRADDKGISVEVPVPAYSYATDLAEAIKRGDMRGMSFIFDVVDDKWESRDGVPHRTVLKADLFEVSYVYFPAYSASDAGLRGVPIALPVAGEVAAREAAYAAVWKPLHERQRQRMRMAESY